MEKIISPGIKLINADLFALMGSIVDSRVEHYRSDFDIDKKILSEAAGRKDREDRIYLWLCRNCGTWLLRERDVFIRGTREYDTFCFYAEELSEGISAFAVEVAGIQGDTVTGNLYALDYMQHYRHVKSLAQKAGSILFVYENGQRTKPAGSHIYGYDDSDYGKFQYFRFQPENDGSLSGILSGERRMREAFKTGNFAQYTTVI